MNVIIIGGGPAGMLAGISAAQKGDKVTIIEKMNSCGKKLLITGKGRCNITNCTDVNGFIENTPCNGRFLYGALNNFDNNDIISMLEQEGVKTKVERGGRVFPVSDRSQDVLNALLRILKKLNVKILTNTEVKKILIKDGRAVGIALHGDPHLNADKIILATGGKSYPVTGSTGDGYILAKELGHTITQIKPSLIPLVSKNEECPKLQGLSLRNVGVKLKNNDKVIYEDFGEMLFTHYGVSGPVILSSSAHLVRYKNVDELLKNGSIKLNIDLKPALSEEKLDLRILRDFEEVKNKEFKNSLDKLLPQKLIPIVIEKTKINPYKRVNEITKEERLRLVKILKCFEITINGVRPIEEAIITSGGISTKEISPKTMESKIVKGLYFAGEIIDVDSFTGGFNLQIAWSTRIHRRIGLEVFVAKINILRIE
ncbi:MAG: NAD(P)/FAD-dependent oxidoreductase [Clostridia bacterium]|nr:NAD(P)/FAD-dependent oxidoreductase [Clostridia bacterium]